MSVDNELFRQRLKNERVDFIDKALTHVKDVYGPIALEEAWQEFHRWGFEDEKFDEDSEELQLFLPWFIYDWTPDANGSEVNAEAPRDIPPALSLLKSKDADLTDLQREYAKLCSLTGFSFYELLEVTPGQGFKTKDLLTADRFDVVEKAGSEIAKRGFVIFGKIVTIQGLTTFEACSSILIPPENKIEILEFRRAMSKKKPPISRKLFWEFDQEIQTFYQELFGLLTDRKPPAKINEFGEVVVYHTLTYDLLVSPDDALKALADLDRETSYEELRDELAEVENGKLVSIEFTWTKKNDPKEFDYKYSVFGFIDITGPVMKVDLETVNRVAEFEVLLEERLSGKYKLRSKVIESAESYAEKYGPEDGDTDDAREARDSFDRDPSIQAHLAQMAAAYWDTWVTTELAELGDRSPQEAVKSKPGREAVRAMISQFEADAATGDYRVGHTAIGWRACAKDSVFNFLRDTEPKGFRPEASSPI